jgi:signal transduction histidine kinase
MPPYDRGFQIIVGDPAAVTLLNHGWIVAPDVLYYGISGLLAVFAIWWVRERQAAAQRRVSRRMMELSEELLTAPTAVELAQKIETALPPLLNPGVTFLYVFNRGAKSLERVPTTTMPDRHSIEVDSPIGTLAAAAALCFRNRALLEIPNTRKSPLVNSLEIGNVRGALFVPLFAQSEPVGVLAIHYHHPVRRLSPVRRTAVQHLGNMMAASLRLQEQQWMRDQLFRSAKMAAAGQLISGVANDLREPLTKIGDVARQALQSGNANGSVLHDIDQAARHGVEIVQHLLAFSRMERSEPRPLDIFSLVSSLVEMRQLECAAKGERRASQRRPARIPSAGDGRSGTA